MLPRQTIWIAAAVLAPCIALSVLFARLLEQETQLDARRATEAAARRLADARQAILAQIEPHRLGQTPEAQLTFRGTIRDGRVVLAWQSATDPEVLSSLEKAVQASDRARLAQIAALPHHVTDEYGVPIAVYALPHLATPQREPHQRRLAVEAAASPHVLSPMGLRLAGAPPAAVRNAEIAERFRQSNPAPLPAGQWLTWGSPLQLVGFAPTARPGELALRAVPAPPGATVDHGEPLGPPFANLRLALPPLPANPARSRATLVAMFSMTIAGALLAGFLLLRDARRETALAQLRNQFIAGVSHELRTPLTSLRIFIESMQMTPELDETTRQEYLATMLHETDRLGRLVNNVLEFSRIERQTKTYQRAPVDLPALIESILASAHPMFERAGFTVKTDLSRCPPTVDADRDALEQAMLNLLTNALKYSGRSREIRVSATADHGHAVLAVRDFGAGISAAEHTKIFQSFYRVPSPENRNIQGAGLGLTLVKHVAEGHGGAVAVESEPGQGSTFSIRIPL
jgi:two-component system phosphate regulon sensor histidine kinase PhoR